MCTGKLTLSAKRPTHGKRMQAETVGTAPFTLLPGTSISVNVPVSRAGKVLLSAGRGDLRATLTISSPGLASSGGSTTVPGTLSRMLVNLSGPPSSWL